MKFAAQTFKKLASVVLVMLGVTIGSAALVRFAPGYLSDAREMDARYASSARAELSAEAARSGSLRAVLATEVAEWTRGELGISRQYGVPVLELVRPRLLVTGSIISKSILFAWLIALSTSLISSSARNPSAMWQAPATVLLAAPTGAIAVICLLLDNGGPTTVMTLVLAARDFKFLDRMLRTAWREPHILHARSQGIGKFRLLRAYMLPSISSKLFALATLSIITALGTMVPVEVIFNVPGLGELAWNAAMNRDLPVLLAVAMIMALAVTLAGTWPRTEVECEAP